jgi:hypothetical protein
MPTTNAEPTNAEENDEDIELESKLGRGARLTFMASLGFWPLFLFAVKFMLDAPINAGAALTERKILVDDAWCYPLIVVIAWLLAKQGMRRGRSDLACVLPWILPALAASYWLVYFML